ncbi:MAG: hypothetical protein Q7S00_03700 [bacterium]|nr:hypothetical protein [bacterium]
MPIALAALCLFLLDCLQREEPEWPDLPEPTPGERGPNTDSQGEELPPAVVRTNDFQRLMLGLTAHDLQGVESEEVVALAQQQLDVNLVWQEDGVSFVGSASWDGGCYPAASAEATPGSIADLRDEATTYLAQASEARFSGDEPMAASLECEAAILNTEASRLESLMITLSGQAPEEYCVTGSYEGERLQLAMKAAGFFGCTEAAVDGPVSVSFYESREVTPSCMEEGLASCASGEAAVCEPVLLDACQAADDFSNRQSVQLNEFQLSVSLNEAGEGTGLVCSPCETVEGSGTAGQIRGTVQVYRRSE